MNITINVFPNTNIDARVLLNQILNNYKSKEDKYKICSIENVEQSNSVNITFSLDEEYFSPDEFNNFIKEKCKLYLKSKIENSSLTIDEYAALSMIFKKFDKDFKFDNEEEFLELKTKKDKVKEEQLKSINRIFDYYNKKIDHFAKAKQNEINSINKKFAGILEDLNKLFLILIKSKGIVK